METCVLIPSEFSLVLRPRDNSITSPITNGFVKKKNDKNCNGMYEMGVCVWSNQNIRKGCCFLPFQGTIRLDRLEVYRLLDDNDIRHRFGCFDEIQKVDDQRVRHCNWIRFLRHVETLTEDVNLIGRIVRGEVIYETIDNVAPNTEMVVYYDAKKLTDSYATLYPSLLASTPVMRNHHHTFICRQTLQDSPLDLSMSLVTSPSSGSSSSSSSSASSLSLTSSPNENRKPSLVSLSLDLSKSSSNATLSPKISILNNTINSIKSKLGTVVAGNGNHEVPMNYSSDGSPSPVSKSSVTPLIVKKPRERTMLPCEYCGKAFDRPSLLRRHLRTHTGEKPHVCDVCGKGFSTSSSLNTHRRIHSGEKPHQCPVCGKRFTASSNLYYHRMTHNKVKPHACQLCSKSFPTPGDLKSHMYVHNGSWPFKCHICNRGFSKQTNLRNHMYLHSGDRPHECEVCQKRFALACNLRAHLKTHEEPQSQKCQRCGREFPTATGLVTFGCCHECYHNSHGIPLLRHK